LSKEAPRYNVELTSGAKKDLKSNACKPHLKAIMEEIKSLKDDPFAGDPLEGSLSKVRSIHFTLKGSGEWRTAYYVLSKDRVCLILLVGPRENFYRKAKKRYDVMKPGINKRK